MNNGMKAVMHGVVTLVLFTLPVILMSAQPWLNLTVGGILTMVYHYLLAFKTA